MGKSLALSSVTYQVCDLNMLNMLLYLFFINGAYDRICSTG